MARLKLSQKGIGRSLIQLNKNHKNLIAENYTVVDDFDGPVYYSGQKKKYSFLLRQNQDPGIL
jgi:hypothetical protein